MNSAALIFQEVMASNSSMPEPLPLDEQHLANLAAIRDVDMNALRGFLAGLKAKPAKPTRIPALASALPTGTSLSDFPFKQFLQEANSLHGWVRHAGLTIDAVLDGLNLAIENTIVWTPEEKAAWGRVEPIFQEIVRLPIIRLTAAANELFFEHANLLRRVRILTDVRPIFDEAAEHIEGAVISHTLRLVFQSIDGAHDLSIAMDQMDVEGLVEQCERAIQKSKVAMQLLVDKANVPSIVSGDIGDE